MGAGSLPEQPFPCSSVDVLYFCLVFVFVFDEVYVSQNICKARREDDSGLLRRLVPAHL